MPAIKPPQRTATAPMESTHQKGAIGFFKRHLPHRRRSEIYDDGAHTPPPLPTTKSSVSPQKQPQTSVSPPKEPATHENLPNGHSGPLLQPPQQPKSAMRRGSQQSQRRPSHVSILEDESRPINGTAHGEAVDDAEEAIEDRIQSRGVTFAPDYREHLSGQPRPRRTSSSTTTRRMSIYSKGAQGGYLEGVDAGVGSKARRLSVAFPEEFQVDECNLKDHFSYLQRHSPKEIGSGGAAVVKLMTSNSMDEDDTHSKVFAVKEFREWDSQEEEKSDYVRKIKSEYAIAKSCEHPNVVKTFRLCVNDTKWYHVMEFCDLGDLNDIINSKYLSPEDRNCMFKQLIRGVEFLHSHGIAHRDLKSENILVTRNGCLKIADFGTAECFCGTHPGLRHCRRNSHIGEDEEVRLCKPGLIGTKAYMAPEIFQKIDYDPRGVDIWACAIVYITLVVGGTPWDHASDEVNNFRIFRTSWDRWLEAFPDHQIKEGRPLPDFARTPQFRMLDDDGTRTFVMGMLHPEAEHRWSAADVLETKAVTEAPCCQQEGYSEDIKTRQRKAKHNHTPPAKKKNGGGGVGFLKAKNKH